MRNTGIKFLLIILLCLAALTTGAAPKEGLSVGGLGLFGNINMERRLNFLHGTDSDGREFSLLEIEDIAYILLQQLMREGHPAPEVDAIISFADGHQQTNGWSMPFTDQFGDMPRSSPIQSVRFVCRPGLLNYYNRVEIQGLEDFDQKKLMGYFKPSGVLVTRKRDLVYTGANFETRMAHLLRNLQDQGYQGARVAGRRIEPNPITGEVDVQLQIDKGQVHKVGEVRKELTAADGTTDLSITDQHVGETFNTEWLRAQRQEILNTLYAEGYPDTRIFVEQILQDSPGQDHVQVDLLYRINRGAKVSLAGIRFDPDDIVKESVLRRTIGLDDTEVYDLVKVEEGRRSLLSLGVFNDVDLEQEDAGPDGRIAVYKLSPLPRQSLRLRAGWGSYEQLRAGLRWEQRNLWDLAHRYEFDMMVSTKSFSSDLSYIIPHFFSDRMTAYARIGHEFREEISYDRTTTTLLLGTSRRLQWPGTEVSLEYSLEQQSADRESADSFASTDEVTVSSLSGRFVLDRRDSALYPTSGYDFSLTSKTATEALGGEADFQKFDLTSSYHRYLGGAVYLHLSLRYGVIFSKTPTDENLPFTERFFLGGENSVRGYNRGEAAPVSVDGNATGAESYILGNVELEQRIISGLSVIIFWDGLAQSEDMEMVPDSEFLSSVGIGLRLRTPVGPIRLEYGHNLNPRPTDPDGTLHISVGYPF